MSGGANKQPILEIDLNLALCGLDLTYEQFVDLCILCGCDYCSSIKGIGPKTALKLIRQYKNLEGIIQFVKRDHKKKYQLPKDWTSYRLKPEPPTVTINEEGETDGGDVADTKGSGEENPVELVEALPLSNDCSVVSAHAQDPPQDGLVASAVATVAATAVDIEESDEDDGLCLPDPDEEEVAEEEADDIEFIDLDNDEGENAAPLTEEEEEDDGEGELVEPMYIRARQLFYNHEVIGADEVTLKWLPPQEEELKKFLVERMGFDLGRVENGIKKLVEAQGKKSQQRLDR
jgi:5'-3' exonuclease